MERILFGNAVFIHMDPARARSQALLVENGSITALGRDADFTGLSDCRRVDLDGAFVLPAFMDCHCHPILAGLAAQGPDFHSCRSVDDVLCVLAAAARSVEPGSLIHAYGLEDLNLQEARMPTARELERAAPLHPVAVFHATCHRVSLNTAAMRLFAVSDDLEGLDIVQGGPSGIVRDPGVLTWVFPALMRHLGRHALQSALGRAARAALAAGLGSLQAMEGGHLTPGCAGLVQEMAPGLPVRITIWNQDIGIEETLRLGLPRVGGCICADGELDARTAALFEPYADDPGNRGTLLYSHAEMDEFVWKAHSQGLQVAVHCESERSMEQVLRAVEKAQARLPRSDCRHRMEHCELPAPGQLKRMAAAGVIASVQPAFVPELASPQRLPRYESLFGPQRAARLHPYADMARLGVRLCGGSDCPVTPFSPLAGIQAAVLHPFAAQRLDLNQAVGLFTCDAARSVFEEGESGSLEPGNRADFTLLGEDPWAVDQQDIASIAVRGVYLDGKRAG